MSDYGPGIKVCRVYEKTSEAGNTYFVGRWGAARINILRSRETADDGTPIWEVLFYSAPAPLLNKLERPPWPAPHKPDGCPSK